jgi:hypothetical protein
MTHFRFGSAFIPFRPTSLQAPAWEIAATLASRSILRQRLPKLPHLIL